MGFYIGERRREGGLGLAAEKKKSREEGNSVLLCAGRGKKRDAR